MDIPSGNYATLVAFYTTPAVNTYDEAAGSTSMVIIFTLVDVLKIGEMVAVTIGYDLPDNPRLNVTLNTKNHTAEIRSNVLQVNFTGINSTNLSNSTVITINLLGSKFNLLNLHHKKSGQR